MGRVRPMAIPRSSIGKLEPRVQHVSETTIKKRWKKLPVDAQEDVRDILMNLKKLAKSNQKYGKTEPDGLNACVDDIANKLIERLPRMPFPPTTSEEAFDFELTLHRIRNVEDQLAADVHSLNLLRTQIAHEEQLLMGEEQEAKQLEESFRNSELLRRQQTKNLHPTARTSVKPKKTRSGDKQDEEPHLLDMPKTTHIDITTLQSDPAMGPVLAQLRHHLGSMRQNITNMLPIVDDISATTNTLQKFSKQASR